MPSRSPADRRSHGALVRRLDRVCGDLNAVLLAVALGLAALDFTLFVTLRVCDTLARNQLSEQALAAADRPASPR